MKRNRYLAGIALVAIVITACGLGDSFDREQMLSDTGANVVIPTYSAFETSAEALATSAEAFCDAPNVATLETLQTQWKEARTLWKRMDVARFGPYVDEPLRLGPKLDSWPVRESTLESNLLNNERLGVEVVEMLGASSRGLPALEYFVFDPNGLDAAFEALSQQDAVLRCEYVVGLAHDIAANASQMVDAWSPEGGNYAARLASPGETDAPFMSIRDATNEVLNRMVFLMEDIQRMKLGIPLGVEAGGVPQPDEVESRYSNHSIEDILANLDGLEDMYLGSFAGQPSSSIQAWVRTRSLDADADFLAALASARTAVEAIPAPLSVAVVQTPAVVEVAIDAIRELRTIISVDIINAVSGTLTFNDTDGD